MKIRNISDGKIIGIGDVTVLPGETREVPGVFETSPVLEVYKRLRLAEIIGTPDKETAKKEAAKSAQEKKARASAAEKLRKERLANIDTMSDEEVAAVAKEYGITPSSCKDLADVRTKVKTVLEK